MALFTEIISFEAEYGRSRQETGSPALTLVTGSLLVSLPGEIARFRPYFVSGLGLYRQSAGVERETSMATAEGFGTFVRIGGPLHGRFDYRAIQLRGEPLQGKQKRFYAGLFLRL